MKSKFKVVTLGCRTNQYESQGYKDQLLQMGWESANEGEEAELCIVNSCTVTDSADSASRHEIRKLARENPGAKIVVTGCSADQNPDVLAKLEGVTHVVPNKRKEQLIEELLPEEDVPEFSIKNFDAHTRAFVKVQDGCNSFCTYCIIPYVRGRSRSRTMEEVLQEVRGLITNGYKEIVLTGINIGDFDGGKEENPDSLADLVRAVDELEGLERLRVSSIDPDEVDDALLDAIVKGKKTCQSMHIVLQSGSNTILKRMNRKYTRQMFAEAVERLKRASPDFTFTTDIIVGFPGETQFDFEETLSVMEEVQFAKVHMFPYSPRKRTRAALYPNRVPIELVKERKQKLLRVAEKQAIALREAYIGRRMSVLTESKEPKPGWVSGHTDNFLQVLVYAPGVEANELIEVELIENSPKGLIGRLLS